MWGLIDGTSKVEIAREVMADLINEWNESINLELIAYGHRRKGDCSDIETLIEPGPLNKDDYIKTVNSIRPIDKTPISAAVGEVITISWTGVIDSTDQRVALARKDQPDFSWITVKPVGDEQSVDVTMPDKEGVYEIRFLDIKGQKLLGRSVINVK